MKRFSFSIFVLGALLLPSLVHAQVTIGMGKEPNAGSLLDLKSQDADASNVNATKGLGMPRVRLFNVSELRPMLDAATATEKNTHIGLMVYNTNQCMLQGLYVWEGAQWTALGTDNILSEMVVKLGTTIGIPATNGVAWHKDHEGNIFFSMNYDAANPTLSTNRWMTTNLATKTYAPRTQGTAWGGMDNLP